MRRIHVIHLVAAALVLAGCGYRPLYGTSSGNAGVAATLESLGAVHGALGDEAKALEFFTGFLETALGPDELLTEVRNRWQFYRDRRPDAYDDLVRP